MVDSPHQAMYHHGRRQGWWVFLLLHFTTSSYESIDETIDLLLGHPSSFGGAEGPLLLLAPVIDKAGVLGVAG